MRKVKSFHVFITGGAGVREPHLIKSIFMSLSKVLGFKGDNADKSTILLLASNGVAAININGTTIQSGLEINVGQSKVYFRQSLYILCTYCFTKCSTWSQINITMKKCFQIIDLQGC